MRLARYVGMTAEFRVRLQGQCNWDTAQDKN